MMSHIGAILSATFALFAALLMLGCGGSSGSGDGKFESDAYPITFEYPSDWTESDSAELTTELGNTGEDITGIGLDDSNGIILERFELNVEIGDSNIDRAQAELDSLIVSIDPSATSEIGETGGYPSITYDTVDVPEPEGAVSKLVALFEGNQEYLINCQSTGDNDDEVAKGCDRALGSIAPK